MDTTPGSPSAASRQETQSVGLIREAATGDAAALTRLYDTTGAAVFGFILNLLSTRDAAEEVLLDTYTDAWRQAPSVDPVRSGAQDWLKTLTRARVIKKLHSGYAGVSPVSEDSADPAPVPPPEYLKDLLLARLAREPQNPAPTPPPAAARPTGLAATAAADPVRTWRPWILAAALAAAAILMFYNWRTAERAMDEQSRQVADTLRATEQMREKLKAQTARTDELDRVDAVLRSPGTRILAVESLPAAPHVALSMFWDVQAGQCILLGMLPVPQAGKQYQLWLATPSAKTSLALLELDPAGRVFMKVPFPAGGPKPTSLQITLEPRGGSPQPSTDVYAAGKIG